MLLREFDERGGWDWGFRSCADWLSWRTGLDRGAAREKVRVASATRAAAGLEGVRRQRKLPWATIDGMPTVLREGPYRFYFHSHEPNEPPHVHVDRDDESAKFWLSPVALARNFGFRAHELRQIERLVAENQQTLLEAWYGYHGHES